MTDKQEQKRELTWHEQQVSAVIANSDSGASE